MGHIRPFGEHDIAPVAHLHRTSFRLPGPVDLEAYARYFTETFVRNPAGHGALPSLVYEEDGRIRGFLGLVPRRVSVEGRRFDALVSSQFVVDPTSAVGLVALRLAKAYLSGPQDLSIADEANDASRRIWEGLGGATALVQSIHWTRALRPARFLLDHVGRRRRLAPFAVLARPLAAVVDVLAAGIRASRLRPPEPAAQGEELTEEAMIAHGPAVCGRSALRVDYDAHTAGWLFRRAARGTGGRLLKAAVRNGEKVLGWYICRLGTDGVAEVLQLAAATESAGHVLDHLFHRAWRKGAVAITGRLDPRSMQALSDRYCVFHRRGPWMLFHSNRPQLVAAFHTGAVCLSRIDGEWSLRYQPPVH